MHVVYSFRLREPWELVREGIANSWRRNFNAPPNVAAGESLRLAVVGLPAGGDVSLNGTPLARHDDPDGTAVFAIAEPVAYRGNRIVIMLPATHDVDATRFPLAVELQIVADDRTA